MLFPHYFIKLPQEMDEIVCSQEVIIVPALEIRKIKARRCNLTMVKFALKGAPGWLS